MPAVGHGSGDHVGTKEVNIQLPSRVADEHSQRLKNENDTVRQALALIKAGDKEQGNALLRDLYLNGKRETALSTVAPVAMAASTVTTSMPMQAGTASDDANTIMESYDDDTDEACHGRVGVKKLRIESVASLLDKDDPAAMFVASKHGDPSRRFCICAKGSVASGPGAINGVALGVWPVQRGYGVFPIGCGSDCGCVPPRVDWDQVIANLTTLGINSNLQGESRPALTNDMSVMWPAVGDGDPMIDVVSLAVKDDFHVLIEEQGCASPHCMIHLLLLPSSRDITSYLIARNKMLNL